MNAADILKGLRNCCSPSGRCIECPIEDGCVDALITAAADLIERQKEEIERERHLNDKRRLSYEDIRADAIKGFSERVKQRVKGIYLDEKVLAEVLDEVANKHEEATTC